MTIFEKLLAENQLEVERFVKFKIANYTEAEDILQEVYLAAYRNYEHLNSTQSFKAWIIGIARNKCNDYFRKKAKQFEIPLDQLSENALLQSRYGYVEHDFIIDVLNSLCDKDKQILYLSYWEELPQAQIAQKLDIPIGTVKSRLFAAKQNFKNKYSYTNSSRKVDEAMKKLPTILPNYHIHFSTKEPFPVRCEELQGLSIIPKLGEQVVWGLYEFASKKCDEYSEVKVVGKAEVHGIQGVEIKSLQHDLKNNQTNERYYVAQLTDTHCRYLSETHYENDVKRCITFLDGKLFMNNWGFGKDNCGNEIELTSKGLLLRDGKRVEKKIDGDVIDVVGRCTLEINSRSYDAICVMEAGHFGGAIVIEQYIDKNGRTLLWRRFNRDDWAYKRYQKKWSEQLPNNEQLIVNGETYVHWYDCITDYIL